MKEVICDVCGKSDIIKRDGVFFCQNCGCKYSIDEIKKNMTEKPDNDSGNQETTTNSSSVRNDHTNMKIFVWAGLLSGVVGVILICYFIFLVVSIDNVKKDNIKTDNINTRETPGLQNNKKIPFIEKDIDFEQCKLIVQLAGTRIGASPVVLTNTDSLYSVRYTQNNESVDFNCNKDTGKLIGYSDNPINIDKKLDNEYKVGDIVEFGRYYKNNSWDKEPLEWIVLRNDKNKALLITKNCIDIFPKSVLNENKVWDVSGKRRWLNVDFYREAFSVSERNKIINVSNDFKSKSYTDRHESNDNVFLLSKTEAGIYFKDDYSRRCESTTYIKIKTDESNVGWRAWLLRDPGDMVIRGGQVGGQEYFPLVRPAIWIDL